MNFPSRIKLQVTTESLFLSFKFPFPQGLKSRQPATGDLFGTKRFGLYLYPVAQLSVQTAFNIDLQFETAPFHRRLFAWIIDLAILIFFWYAMANLIEFIFGLEVAAELGFVQLFLITPMLLYHLLWELFLNGQSPGKKLTGIRVVGINGQQATVSQYLLRWLMRFVDFGFLWGFMMLLSGEVLLGLLLLVGSLISFIHFVSSDYHQRLGDKAAGTVLVTGKLPYKLSDTIFQEVDDHHYRVTFPTVMRLSDKDINIVDNIVKQHHRSAIDQYVHQVANKIQTVLHIETDLDDDVFLETLLRDYNYLSKK